MRVRGISKNCTIYTSYCFLSVQFKYTYPILILTQNLPLIIQKERIVSLSSADTLKVLILCSIFARMRRTLKVERDILVAKNFLLGCPIVVYPVPIKINLSRVFLMFIPLGFEASKDVEDSMNIQSSDWVSLVLKKVSLYFLI